MNRSKTIHVDFKNKCIDKVKGIQETDMIIPDARVQKWKDWVAAHRSELDDPNFQNVLDEMQYPDISGKHGLIVDPAAYLEVVAMKFDQYLNARGCFDDSAYADEGVHVDGLRAFQALKREIPMLIDSMEVLREIIMEKTGIDPDPDAHSEATKKPTGTR